MSNDANTICGCRKIAQKDYKDRRDILAKQWSLSKRYSLGCVPLGWYGSVSVIRDYWDDGRSSEAMNPCPEWIHRFTWSTIIPVISYHWSWSESSERNAALDCKDKWTNDHVQDLGVIRNNEGKLWDALAYKMIIVLNIIEHYRPDRISGCRQTAKRLRQLVID